MGVISGLYGGYIGGYMGLYRGYIVILSPNDCESNGKEHGK